MASRLVEARSAPPRLETEPPVVAMCVRNAVTHDARVLREAEALVDAGYRVVIFGIKSKNVDETARIGRIDVIRLVPASRLLALVDWYVRWPKRMDARLRRRRRARVLRRRRYKQLAKRGRRRAKLLMKRALRRARVVAFVLPRRVRTRVVRTALVRRCARSLARARRLRWRRVKARLRRRWRLLTAEPSARGRLRALGDAMRTPRTALVAMVFLPLAFATLFAPTVPRRRRASLAAAPPLADAATAPIATPVATPAPPKVFRSTRVLDRIYRWNARMLAPIRPSIYRLAFQQRAGRAMAALQPVAYHCHDFNTLWAGRVGARRHAAPVIYDSHEVYLERNLAHMTPFKRRTWRLVEARLARRVDAVITVNQSIAEHLERECRIAPPVVLMNVPAPGAPPERVAVPDVFLGSEPKVLYLGGVTVGRGIEQAIQALSFLDDALLICMGPVVREEYQERFESLAAKRGVADRVVFVPAVPPEHIDAIAAYATVGLSVLRNLSLNNYYSLPNKLFSYIQAGVPVVVSDFPELRRVVLEHDIGAVCDPEDPRALAAAIASVIDDPERYRRLRENVRIAAQRFTWSVESQKLLRIYRRLAPVEEPRPL